jgi:hypothetical protein
MILKARSRELIGYPEKSGHAPQYNQIETGGQGPRTYRESKFNILSLNIRIFKRLNPVSAYLSKISFFLKALKFAFLDR